MYKNLSQIAAHKKRLWSKVVVPNFFFPFKLLCLVVGNSFFQSAMFFYFTKVVAVIHISMDTVFFKRTLAAMNCVYTMYLTDI